MSDGKRFVGRRSVFVLPSAAAIPDAIGRASLIYRALDEEGRPVCVKVYKDPDAHPGPYRSRTTSAGAAADVFESELEAYRDLEHPNILRLVDYGRDEETGTLFLALPWCDGGDLRGVMKRRHFFSTSDALSVLRPIALALDYSHARGFIHGDIKPENVLFSGEGSHVYLSDFGSTRRAAYDEQITAEGAGRSTTIYLSPEQISDNAATASSDIYAFGMMAYEMLTGRMPVNERETAYKQMVAKITGNLVPASKANGHLPKHAASALMLALEVDPANRPSSTTQLCAMISGEVPVPTAKRPGARRRLSSSQKVAITTAVIAAVGALLVAIVETAPKWRGSSPAEAAPSDSSSR